MPAGREPGRAEREADEILEATKAVPILIPSRKQKCVGVQGVFGSWASRVLCQRPYLCIPFSHTCQCLDEPLIPTRARASNNSLPLPHGVGYHAVAAKPGMEPGCLRTAHVCAVWGGSTSPWGRGPWWVG
jgi:hypothetical protein